MSCSKMAAESVENSIKSLRELVQDLIPEDNNLTDDIYLLQWLKVKKFNVNQAAAGIQVNIGWKRELKAEELLTEAFPEELVRRFPLRYEFETHNGRPVLYCHEDEAGLSSLIKLFGKSMLVRYFCKCGLKLEKILLEFNRKMNKNVTKLTPEGITGLIVICDGDGYTFRHVSSFRVLQFYYELVTTYVKNVPYIASSVWYINSNKWQVMGLTVVKPLIQGTIPDVRIFGEEDTWAQVVFNVIEPPVLRQLNALTK